MKEKRFFPVKLEGKYFVLDISTMVIFPFPDHRVEVMARLLNERHMFTNGLYFYPLEIDRANVKMMVAA